MNQMSNVTTVCLRSDPSAAPGAGSSGAYCGNRSAEMRLRLNRAISRKQSAEKDRFMPVKRMDHCGFSQLEGTLDGHEPSHAAGLQ